jgi:hypothetical protein
MGRKNSPVPSVENGPQAATGRSMRKAFVFNLGLSCLLLGCSSAQERPSPKAMTADDALAAVQPLIDRLGGICPRDNRTLLSS